MIACLLIAGNEMPRSTGSSRSRGRAWSWPAWLVVVAAAVAACSSGGPPAQSPSATAQSPSATLQSPSAPAQICQQLAVPAYFYPSATWAQAADSKPAPSNMILDISGVGAGDGPVAHFQAVVRQARARNITVLGYISTVDGQRPAAQVEAEVRNYRAWYGVTSIFLNRVSGLQPQVAYYQQLVDYIHHFDAGSSVWLNPGDYPDQDYMSIGDVVMVFEGTYSQYVSLQVPGWVSGYPPSKFAHTIYAAPAAVLGNVLQLAANRRAGHVYVTDASGDNPYDVLPSYWSREAAAASAGCAGR